MRQRYSLFALLLLVGLAASAQHTDLASYYAAAKGKKGQALKTALCGIIYAHTTRSYGDLWTDFRSTDARADDKVWDMYSGTSDFTFGTDQAGQYSKEGDKYNREHSFPNSWFGGEKSPMYTDLHHLYPTDGYVNGRRGNYAFGETSSPTYSSANGFSKLGPCSTAGCPSGTTVFEPNDLYKGDFARTYFYMVTCYENEIEGWYTNYGTKDGIKVTLDGQKYPGLQAWQLTMLRRWSAADAVSDKETARNQAVDKIQGNRNPFIDFPGLEEYIWGDKTEVAFDPENYGTEPVTPVTKPAAPTFSLAAGTYASPRAVTIAAEDGCTVYYYWGNSAKAEPSVKYTGAVSMDVPGTYYLRAYAQTAAGVKSDVAEATYVYSTAADGVFRKVTSAAQLEAGKRYLIVYEEGSLAMGAVASNTAAGVSVTITDGAIDISGLATQPVAFTLDTRTVSGVTYYTLRDEAKSAYLATSGSNNLTTTTTAGDNMSWSITLSGGKAKISAKSKTSNQVLFRTSTYNYFKNFSSSNLGNGEYFAVALYVETEAAATDLADGYYQLRNAAGGYLHVGQDGALGVTADGGDLGTVFTLRKDAAAAAFTLSAQGKALAATTVVGAVNTGAAADALTIDTDSDGQTVRFGSGLYLDAAARASQTADGWTIAAAPAMTRTLNTPAGGTSSFGTLYVPFAFTVETDDTNVYTVRVSGNEGVTTALSGIVPPATAVVLENADAASSVRIVPAAAGMDAEAPAQDLQGTFLPIATVDGAYTFAALDGVPGFYKYTGATLGGNKAYLVRAGSSVRGFVLDLSGATAIRQPATQATPGGPAYDLQGRRVTRPARGGIYLRDGRKVLVR